MIENRAANLNAVLMLGDHLVKVYPDRSIVADSSSNRLLFHKANDQQTYSLELGASEQPLLGRIINWVMTHIFGRAMFVEARFSDKNVKVKKFVDVDVIIEQLKEVSKNSKVIDADIKILRTGKMTQRIANHLLGDFSDVASPS